MSFLAPLFLLGTLAVGLPVVFHLIRRTTRERTRFSSLIFLMPTPPRLTRRSRLEHLLLLLLRCLVLCLLALAFARPFLSRPMTDVADNGARRILVLVDTSASMRRGGLWAEARSRAREALRQASPADQVALFTFDRQLKPLFTFEQWAATPAGERAAAATVKLDQTSPGWAATLLGSALLQAAETLTDVAGKPAPGPAQIVLITDLQEGCRLEPVQGYEWPKGVVVSVEAVKGKVTSNAALQLAAEAETLAPAAPGASAPVRVRVSNAGDARREQFEVGWARADGRAVGKPVEVYVPPGQSRIVSVPAPPGETSLDRIVLRGDDEPFDNTVFVTLPVTAQASVVYLGSESATDPKQPLYFLERAFQQTRRQNVRLLAHAGPEVPALAELAEASLLVAGGALPETSASLLRQQMLNGKTLLFCLRAEADAATLARLLDLPGVTVTEAHPDNYAMLADIDFKHPLFAPFADPRFSDFTKIHFWNYRRVEGIPDGRVLAKFDAGAPALVEVPVGTGRLLLLASGWQPSDSQLALSTKFVPFLYSLLQESGAPAPPPAQYNVGDVVPLAAMGAKPADATATIQMPDGSQTVLAAGQTNFAQTLTPGVYRLMVGQNRAALEFAVNLDANESRTAPLPTDELERMGAPVGPTAPVAAVAAQRKVTLHNAELEQRQKLWRWIILAAIAVLLAETWLAGRTLRVAHVEGAGPDLVL